MNRINKFNCIYIAPIGAIIFLHSCVFDRYKHKLTLVNKTGHCFSFRLLADTSNLKVGLSVDGQIGNFSTVKPYFARGGNGAWESFINNHSPDSTLNIYLFDTLDIINGRLPQTLINQRKYRKYSYKIKDLEAKKWEVVIDSTGY